MSAAERGTPATVGMRGRRVAGVPRATGGFVFGTDLRADGMLHGQLVRSPHAHARVRSVDASAARAMPGVRAVLTADDLPARRTYGLEFDDQPVLAFGWVRYEGEPVVAVAADSKRQARAAADAVAIEYEPLAALTDMEDALRRNAPRLHDWGNVVRHLRVEHGDPGTGAEAWVEGYYETGRQDQAALGPEAALAVPAADGGIDLHVMTQWRYVDRHQLAPCLGLREDLVRLHLAGIGGAFGSREDVNVEILAGGLALATRRPVMIASSRRESFHGHVHRHPSRYWVRHGATRDGRLVNVRVRAVLNGGAYTSSTPAVISNAAVFATGPYEVPNALIEATAVYTNNPPCGAMRGFGSPQPCFAYESQMDKLARALGMDPVELRLKKAVRTGSVFPTGQVIAGEAPVAELLRRCRAIPLPPEPAGPALAGLPGGFGNVTHGEGVRRGVGYALGFKNIGYSEGFDGSCEARVILFAGRAGPVAEVHSAVIGMGHAVMEEVQLAGGVMRNASFTDYLIPTILDVPPIISEFVERAEPGVPYGAKGAGELPTIPAAAAVVNAIRAATGRELNRIPVRPDDLIGLAGPAVSAGPPPAPKVPGPRPVPEYHGRGAGQQDLMRHLAGP